MSILKTFLDPDVTVATMNRLRQLQPGTPRLWGKMSAHEMVCHLRDSFQIALGERIASPASNALQRTLVKAIALRAPVRWPKGVATRPEVDQERGGTRPAKFVIDLEQLIETVDRFAHQGTDLPGAHPVFGAMSGWEWRRWGYLHADHHLRQFGI